MEASAALLAQNMNLRPGFALHVTGTDSTVCTAPQGTPPCLWSVLRGEQRSAAQHATPAWDAAWEYGEQERLVASFTSAGLTAP